MTVFYITIAFLYFLMLVSQLPYIKREGLRSYGNVLILVLLGLVYDNLTIVFGKWIGEGRILELLSFLRYLMHALWTPTLFLFALEIGIRTGWIKQKKMLWKGLAWLLTLGFIGYEFFSSIIGLELKATWKYGQLTYESVATSGFSIMPIILHIIFVIIGIWLIKKYRYPWLFIGTIIMILGGIFMIWVKSEPMMNGCEWLFMLSLVMTRRFQSRL